MMNHRWQLNSNCLEANHRAFLTTQTDEGSWSRAFQCDLRLISPTKQNFITRILIANIADQTKTQQLKVLD